MCFGDYDGVGSVLFEFYSNENNYYLIGIFDDDCVILIKNGDKTEIFDKRWNEVLNFIKEKIPKNNSE